MGAMLIGILSSSFTFDLFSYQQATLLFFILFGLLWSNFTISSPEAESMRPVAFHDEFIEVGGFEPVQREVVDDE